jgi:hypothetical protein
MVTDPAGGQRTLPLHSCDACKSLIDCVAAQVDEHLHLGHQGALVG